MTPDSRSLRQIPSIIRTSKTEPDQLSQSGDPHPNLERSSSNTAEVAQNSSASGYYGPGTIKASTAGEETATTTQLQDKSEEEPSGKHSSSSPAAETCSEESAILSKAENSGSDQGLVVKDNEAEQKDEKLLEKDPIANGLMKRPRGTGSSVYLRGIEATPIRLSSKKEEEGSSKEAAEMLNRAIDSSDVTQAYTQPLVFSCRPERWVINTMAVERGKVFAPAHEGEATEVKGMEEHISKVEDTAKARHHLSAKDTEEHGINKSHGNIHTIRNRRSHEGISKGTEVATKTSETTLKGNENRNKDSQRAEPGKACSTPRDKDSPRAKLEAYHAQGQNKVRGRHKKSVSEHNIPKVSQMAASKGNGLDGRRKHTGLSPEKNISLEEHQAFQRSQNHTSKRVKVYAVSDRSDGTLRHSQLADLQHSSVGKSKLHSRRSNTEVKNIRNKKNVHSSKGSSRFINKYGAAIGILSCVSDIENLDEMIENNACGLDVETIRYLTSKVKIKVKKTINYIKTLG